MRDDDLMRDFEGRWGASEAPAPDTAFVLAVEARIARRRMQIDIAARAGATLAMAGVIAALWPLLLVRADALVISLDAAGPALAAAAALGMAMAWLTREPIDAEG
ncbi:MAG TPA: hypothetical protein VGL58_05350 [Caulobacteraceae bacterium]|jgi:hypothetical protein